MRLDVIGLSGPQGSGKTSLFRALQKNINARPGWRAEGMTFAEPLYQMHDYCRSMLASNGFPPPDDKLIKDGPLLQFLGTEWGRGTYDENIWVKLLRNRMANEAARIGRLNHERLIFIVSDMRFRNEFEGLPESLRVRLECSEETRKIRCENWRPNTKHASETDLDGYAAQKKFDLYVDTENYEIDHGVELIMAQILKENWKDKRL